MQIAPSLSMELHMKCAQLNNMARRVSINNGNFEITWQCSLM